MPFVAALIEPIIGAIGSIGAAVAGGAEAIGIPAALSTGLGGAVTGGIEGSLLGGAEAGITGGNIGKGLEFGALSGGIAGGLGPELSTLTGSTAIGDTLAGAAGAAAGSAATGKNPLTGALEGAAGGFLSSTLSPTTSAGAPSGGASSAAATAAPVSVASTAPDLALTGGSDVGSALPGGSTSTALPGTVGTGAAGATALQTPGLSSSPLGDFSVSGNAAPSLSSPTGISTPQIAGAEPLASSVGATTGGGTASAGGLKGTLGKALSNPGVDLLALSALKGNPLPSGFSNLQSEANQLKSNAALQENYLSSGTLPPGMQHTLDAAKASTVASIRAQYAEHGMSGSSAEAQDIQAAADRVQAQGQQMAVQLFQQGVSEESAANSIFTELMNVQMQQDSQFSSSVGNLAQALALSSRPVAAAA